MLCFTRSANCFLACFMGPLTLPVVTPWPYACETSAAWRYAVMGSGSSRRCVPPYFTTRRGNCGRIFVTTHSANPRPQPRHEGREVAGFPLILGLPSLSLGLASVLAFMPRRLACGSQSRPTGTARTR